MRALARGCTASVWQSQDLGCKATLPSAACLEGSVLGTGIHGGQVHLEQTRFPPSSHCCSVSVTRSLGTDGEKGVCVLGCRHVGGASCWLRMVALPTNSASTRGGGAPWRKWGERGQNCLGQECGFGVLLVGFVSAPPQGAGLSGQLLRVHCLGDFSCDS